MQRLFTHTHAPDPDSILANFTNCQSHTMLSKSQITKGLVLYRRLYTNLDFAAEEGRNSA